MLLLRWSEYLGLHARADHPEGIGDDIAEKATDSCGCRVQLERLICPPIVFLEVQFRVLVEREVQRVEERDAEYWHWIAYKARLKN